MVNLLDEPIAQEAAIGDALMDDPMSPIAQDDVLRNPKAFFIFILSLALARRVGGRALGGEWPMEKQYFRRLQRSNSVK